MFDKIWPWHKRAKATSSPYIEAIGHFNKMSIPGSEIYQDIRRIEVIFPTIDLYIEVLQRASESLIENRVFTYLGYDAKLQLVQRKNFYLNKDACYLNLEIWHNRFVDVVEIFLEKYEERSNSDEQTVIMETSLSRLLPIVNNLLHLSEHLLPEETSMEK